MAKSNSLLSTGHYNLNYGNFQTDLYAQIRHEAFGEDIGQNSWLTSDEQDRFWEWLDLFPGKTLLDVACGAGGPALRIAATTGCSVVGVDIHEQAIATASSLATRRGLATCHRAFPKLNDIGLAFKDAGFQFSDEDVSFIATPRTLLSMPAIVPLPTKLSYQQQEYAAPPSSIPDPALRSLQQKYVKELTDAGAQISSSPIPEPLLFEPCTRSG